MPEIVETVRLPASADTVWRAVGPFGAVGNWHPMVAKVATENERENCVRRAEGRDGSIQIERLLEAAPEQHFYRYRIESTRMPVRNYVGRFSVGDNGDGTSTVVWSVNFEVTSNDEAAIVGKIRAFLRAGLDNLERPASANGFELNRSHLRR